MRERFRLHNAAWLAVHVRVDELEILLHQVVWRVLLTRLLLSLLATGIEILLRWLVSEIGIHRFEQIGLVQTGFAIGSYESVSIPPIFRNFDYKQSLAKEKSVYEVIAYSYDGWFTSFEKLLELLLMLFVVSMVNLPISMPVSRPPVKSDEDSVLLA